MVEINITNDGSIKAERDINIAGRDIIHNHPQEKEKLLLSPQGPNNYILETAERYWRFITRDKKSMVIYFILPLILSIITGQDYFLTKVFSNIYLTSVGIAVFIVLISVIIMKQTTSCPKCGEGFAMSEIRRVLTNRKRVGQYWINNLDVTSKCRKCKYIHTKPLIIEEEIV